MCLHLTRCKTSETFSAGYQVYINLRKDYFFFFNISFTFVQAATRYLWCWELLENTNLLIFRYLRQDQYGVSIKKHWTFIKYLYILKLWLLPWKSWCKCSEKYVWVCEISSQYIFNKPAYINKCLTLPTNSTNCLFY